jgi:hypothetical protein
MPKLSINIGIILIIVGIISYIATEAVSVTALIPAFFGAVFGGLGMLANRNEPMRKHAMHAALLLAILGLGGSFGGLTAIIGLIFGGEAPERMSAAISQAIMAVLCIIFLVLGVKSFIDARKAQAD